MSVDKVYDIILKLAKESSISKGIAIYVKPDLWPTYRLEQEAFDLLE